MRTFEFESRILMENTIELDSLIENEDVILSPSIAAVIIQGEMYSQILYTHSYFYF